MTDDIIGPGTHVTAHGYDATVIGYDPTVDLYTVEIHVTPAAVNRVEVFEPRDPGVYKLNILGGADLIAQKIGTATWVLMGDSNTYTWPPAKNITDWQRIA